MIDFRYHIVSLVAVFLALALGLFLGSTTLQQPVLNNITAQVKALSHDLGNAQAANGQLRTQNGQDQQFLQALAPYAVAHRLEGSTVAVVVMPGVDGSVADAVNTMVGQAGAAVTARVQIQSSFFDPSQATLLNGLASRLRPPGVHLPSGSGEARASAELAAVLGARPGRTPVPTGREQAVLTSYSDANVISVNGSVNDVRPASLTVVLAPDPTTFDADRRVAAANGIYGFSRDLAAASGGTVLAGPVSAANSSDGALQVARTSSTRPADLATVDSVDGPAGQIAVDFALVEVFDGRTGDFGFGQGAAVPLPSTSATPS